MYDFTSTWSTKALNCTNSIYNSWTTYNIWDNFCFDDINITVTGNKVWNTDIKYNTSCSKNDIALWSWSTLKIWSACNVWTNIAWNWSTSDWIKFASTEKYSCSSWYHISNYNDWDFIFIKYNLTNIGADKVNFQKDLYMPDSSPVVDFPDIWPIHFWWVTKIWISATSEPSIEYLAYNWWSISGIYWLTYSGLWINNPWAHIRCVKD